MVDFVDEMESSFHSFHLNEVPSNALLIKVDLDAHRNLFICYATRLPRSLFSAGRRHK